MSLDLLLGQASAGDPLAQDRLARHYAAQGQYTRARRWFAQAADRGHAAARLELGLFALHGLGQAVDLDAARAQLTAAADAGHAEAHYWLALLAAGGVALPDDSAALQDRALRAALGGDPAARRALAIAAHDRLDPTLGAAALGALAAEGDTISQAITGRLALPAETQPIDWAVLSAALRLAPTLERRVLHEGVHLWVYDAALGPAECAYLIALAEPRLERARVIDPTDGRPRTLELRNNRQAQLGIGDLDLGLRLLERRLAQLAEQPWAHAEPLSLLHYAPGEEYRPHRDVLPPSEAQHGPGQRLRTVFVYLCDCAEGGETDFPQLGVRVAPVRGRVVAFDNVDRDGRPAADSLHASLPVRRGEKWLATLWLRARPIRSF